MHTLPAHAVFQRTHSQQYSISCVIRCCTFMHENYRSPGWTPGKNRLCLTFSGLQPLPFNLYGMGKLSGGYWDLSLKVNAVDVASLWEDVGGRSGHRQVGWGSHLQWAFCTAHTALCLLEILPHKRRNFSSFLTTVAFSFFPSIHETTFIGWRGGQGGR